MFKSFAASSGVCRVGVAGALALLVACGGSKATTAGSSGGVGGAESGGSTSSAGGAIVTNGPGTSGTTGASTGAGGAMVVDVGASGPCPTKGNGAIVTPGATCLAFTPEATGASSAGENPTNANYSIAPDSGTNGKLLLFVNGTGGHPSDSIASATQNFYNAAAELGYYVLAVSYRSNESIGDQCVCVDSCFFPSRQTVITGTLEPGAASALASPMIRVDESIAGRAALALRWLVQNDTAHDWKTFVTSAPADAPPDQHIDWAKIVVAGHSQGGGHAAAIGKLYPVARVIQLSSTCDAAVPAADCSHQADPSVATPASWTSRSNGTWATEASSFWGLDIETVYDGTTWVSGDGTCYEHLGNWMNEGMPTSNQNNQGATCGATTLLENHEASLQCVGNFANWQAMLK